MTINRRKALQGATSVVLAGVGSGLAAPYAGAQAAPRVIIVGGGAGGTACAVALKTRAPRLAVTLIEVQPVYTTCFYSNHHIAGLRTLESLVHSYDGLRKLGIEVVHDWAAGVDATAKTVTLQGGNVLGYDRLVLSPGIDFLYDSVPGYSPEAAHVLPHAFKAGTQTRILRQQLMDMPDGGVVVVVAPQTPYRCPPAPYERVCLMAHYLKLAKPRSKIVVLDPKKAFSKQSLFVEGWKAHYPGMVDLQLSDEIDSHAIARLDAKTKEFETQAGFKIKADVANIIPNQTAGAIAFKAGCVEGNWCPVDPGTFASTKAAGIYVLGDATIAGDMPKSAYSANSQAKVVANAIAAELGGKERIAPTLRNTCWSLIAPGDSVKLGADYTVSGGRLTLANSFISQTGEAPGVRAQNAKDSTAWYHAITAEIFAGT